MDPYLEHPAWWPSLHNRLIAALDQDLSTRLPRAYFVHVDELPVPDEIRETFLEVRRTGTQEVVATVEILSPASKRPGNGRRAYEEKRLQTLGTRTHLVEIDLLRAWEPFPMWLPDQAQAGAGPLPGDYRIVVARGDRRPWADLCAFTLRDAIPPLLLPLQPGDDDVRIDLQALFVAISDRARYREQVDYHAEPVPPLNPADAAWADALLRGQGMR
jgi:hypothetical protein